MINNYLNDKKLYDLGIKEIEDFATISNILNSSCIVKKVGENRPIKNPLASYYGAYIKDRLVGCFLVIKYSINEREVHSYLLKEALSNSRLFGKMIIKKCFEDKKVSRITAWIYEDLIMAINYVKKLGFVLEGIKRKAKERKGNVLDIHLYGLTRGDIQ